MPFENPDANPRLLWLREGLATLLSDAIDAAGFEVVGRDERVAVEYAVPLAASKRAPLGFVGQADEWDANQTFQLWTLHAWLFEVNENGVFNPFNPRVP